MPLDLASLRGVRAFARDYLSRRWPLHLLVNNAGLMLQGKSMQVSADGHELTLATDVLGPFLLTRALESALVDSAPARVVFVGSRLHMPKSGFGGEVHFDFDNLRGEKWYDGAVFYKNARLATMWVAYELQRRLAGKGVSVNVVCPGFVPVTIAEQERGLRRFFLKHVMPLFPGTSTVEAASENTVFVATSPLYATVGGRFVTGQREIPSSAESYDELAAGRFWKLASEMTA